MVKKEIHLSCPNGLTTLRIEATKTMVPTILRYIEIEHATTILSHSLGSHQSVPKVMMFSSLVVRSI